MQVNSINIYNHNIRQKRNQNNSNNSVTFEGIKISSLIHKNVRTERVQELIDDACWRYGNIIGIKTSDLRELTRNADKVRMGFLKALVTNYNTRNFTRAGNLKENPDGLIKIFEKIEKPQAAHFNIVRNTDAPMSLLLKLFENATDKDSLEFIQKMQHEILDGKKSSVKIITDMLKSKNKQEYMQNSANYESYLKLNKNNENTINELDKMLENGTYNKNIFDAKQAVRKMVKNSALRTTIGNDEKYLEENYSKEGEKFLESIYSDYLAHKKGLSATDFSDILNMYKTSSPQNIKTRIDILNKFKYATARQGSEASKSEIRAMKKLFDKMDSDKSSANFVVKVLEDDIKAKSIKDLADILDVVPSKKAEIFHKNIARIVRFTNEKDRVNALKNEIENPFFTAKDYSLTPENTIKTGYPKKESRISKMARFLENKINQMRYNRIEDNISQPTTEVLQIKPAFIPSAAAINTTVNIETKTPIIELGRTFKEMPQARKLRIQKEVNAVIKEKLGIKTFERQQETYRNGALVMRLKLLPEIFESIKDVRKVQKNTGIRPNVEVADAVKLYSRINGKNKKLVNYMLKQTNDKGERIFSVKDIIKHLDKIENGIKEAKIRNPHFKTSEIKEIYNDEFGYLQYEFGKLKRRKKVA